jgi:hypothetical protein
MHDLVNYPTQENNKLDLVLTNVEEYNAAENLSPLGDNDHCCVLVKGQPAKHKCYIPVKIRLITPGRKNEFLVSLSQNDWSNVRNEQNVHQQAVYLHESIDQLLDKHCPYQIKKQRQDKPPWITADIDKTITARDKAYNKGSSGYKQLKSMV